MSTDPSAISPLLALAVYQKTGKWPHGVRIVKEDEDFFHLEGKYRGTTTRWTQEKKDT